MIRAAPRVLLQADSSGDATHSGVKKLLSNQRHDDDDERSVSAPVRRSCNHEQSNEEVRKVRKSIQREVTVEVIHPAAAALLYLWC